MIFLEEINLKFYLAILSKENPTDALNLDKRLAIYQKSNYD